MDTVIGGLLLLMFIGSIVGYLSRDYPSQKATVYKELKQSYKEEAQKYHDEILVLKFDKLLKAAKRKYQTEMRKFKQKQEKPPIKEMDNIVSIIDTEHGKLIRCGKDAVHTKHIVSIKSEPGGEPSLYKGRMGDAPKWNTDRWDTVEKVFKIKLDTGCGIYAYHESYGTSFNSPKVKVGANAKITIESISGKEFSIELPQYLADHAFDMLIKTWKGK